MKILRGALCGLAFICLARLFKYEVRIFKGRSCQRKVFGSTLVYHFLFLVFAHLHMTNRPINPITEHPLVVILSTWYLCRLYVRKFKIELQFSVSDIDLNNLYLKTPRG